MFPCLFIHSNLLLPPSSFLLSSVLYRLDQRPLRERGKGFPPHHHRLFFTRAAWHGMALALAPSSSSSRFLPKEKVKRSSTIHHYTTHTTTTKKTTTKRTIFPLHYKPNPKGNPYLLVVVFLLFILPPPIMHHPMQRPLEVTN